MKFITFDIEIAKDIPENGRWQSVAPLGITCAAVGKTGDTEPNFYQGVPYLDNAECQELVYDLQKFVDAGYMLVTWNGCGFDLAVLAQESGLVEECANLALHHIDLMLIVTFTKGWYLSLQKALVGAGLKGKRKSVKLSDGTVISDMGGGMAPKLWRAGEFDAVLTYLQDDVMELLKLVENIQYAKEIVWTSANGKLMQVPVPKLLTVIECFNIPKPDTSWMTEPPSRREFIEWIPSAYLNHYYVLP